MNSQTYKETTTLIRKDFLLEEEVLPSAIDSLEELRQNLKKVITYLLDKDMNRLLNALYRIDVSEEKVKQVLSNAKADELSGDLTDLIIHRELQKVKTRQQYRSNF